MLLFLDISKSEGADDSASDSSFTISTPSDDEIENMSPIGTLRSDGKLAPPICSNSSTPVPADNDSSEDETFYTPLSGYTPRFTKRDEGAVPSRRSATKSSMGTGVTNPTYEQHTIYANTAGDGNGSVYMTPSAGNHWCLSHCADVSGDSVGVVLYWVCVGTIAHLRPV